MKRRRKEVCQGKSPHVSVPSALWARGTSLRPFLSSSYAKCFLSSTLPLVLMLPLPSFYFSR